MILKDVIIEHKSHKFKFLELYYSDTNDFLSAVDNFITSIV